MIDKNELWCRMAREEFPALSIYALLDLKWQAAVDYSLANESNLGQLYEQYVIMRTLSERPTE